jgi:hypothetical protein
MKSLDENSSVIHEYSSAITYRDFTLKCKLNLFLKFIICGRCNFYVILLRY